MKKILFMLTKSPFSHTETIYFLQRAKPDDMVVFAQDAVFGFTNPESHFSQLILEKLAKGVRMAASESDCRARGVTPPSGIPLVSYADQIDLISEFELFC